jgi:hypothetical protein
MHEGNKKFVQNFGWNIAREETTWGDLGIDKRILLKGILEKNVVKMLTGTQDIGQLWAFSSL